MKASRIIIIGAGLGGLAAGIRLASDGYQVKILEKNAQPGGWLKPTHLNGFTFPNGGAIITAPFLIDQLFEQAGQRREDALELKSISPIFQAVFPNNQSFLYYREPAITSMKNRSFSLKDQQAFHQYGVTSDQLFDKVFFEYCGQVLNHSQYQTGTPFRNLKQLNFLSRFRQGTLNPGMSARSAAAALFEAAEMQTVFSFWPLLRGGNPSSCSHLYRVIPAMLHRWDAFTAVGGSDALIQSLVRLFLSCGGEIQTNAEVQAIQIFNNTATGVRLVDGSIHQTDIVISDADAASSFLGLIDSDRNHYADVENARRKKNGLGVCVYHLGLRTVLQEKQPLTPFNILFPEDVKSWQRAVFVNQTLADESFCFLTMPSKSDPTCAPQGQEAITVIMPVPNLASEINWEQRSYTIRSRILDQIQRLFENDIRENLACEFFIDPATMEKRNGNWLGSAWGFDPSWQHGRSPYMSNQCQSIRNLYLVGNGAHPGPLIPAVLKGAELVEKIIVNS